NYLNKKASDEEIHDLVVRALSFSLVVLQSIWTRCLMYYVGQDDPKVDAVVEKLLDLLSTPSESVQQAVSNCLPPLMRSKQLMLGDRYGDRRGAACGLLGVLKGLGIPRLKKFGIVSVLRGMQDSYVIQILPLLLISFSDQVSAVREAAECAARAVMSQLSAYGVKSGLEDKAERTKQSSVQLLGAMAYCAPEQLSRCLPKIVPELTEVLTDTHPKVQSAGQMALQQVGSFVSY
ncbi:eIF-2-alpha kinase activator, partial [Nymphaea thermarum]